MHQASLVQREVPRNEAEGLYLNETNNPPPLARTLRASPFCLPRRHFPTLWGITLYTKGPWVCAIKLRNTPKFERIYKIKKQKNYFLQRRNYYEKL